jgi:hypothetical protein
MNAPLIWIGLPILIGVALFFLRRLPGVSAVLAVLVSIWLAWVAWKLPFGETISFGKLSLRIIETFSVLGREFILSNADCFSLSGKYFLATGRFFCSSLLPFPLLCHDYCGFAHRRAGC